MYIGQSLQRAILQFCFYVVNCAMYVGQALQFCFSFTLCSWPMVHLCNFTFTLCIVEQLTLVNLCNGQFHFYIEHCAAHICIDLMNRIFKQEATTRRAMIKFLWTLETHQRVGPSYKTNDFNAKGGTWIWSGCYITIFYKLWHFDNMMLTKCLRSGPLPPYGQPDHRKYFLFFLPLSQFLLDFPILK